MEEVLKAVAGVDWVKLDEVLNGVRDSFYSYIRIDRILDEYGDDGLRAVVEESWRHTLHVSWRVVIWALYCANEIDKAQQIRSYAEPLQGILIHVCDPQAFYVLYRPYYLYVLRRKWSVLYTVLAMRCILYSPVRHVAST